MADHIENVKARKDFIRMELDSHKNCSRPHSRESSKHPDTAYYLQTIKDTTLDRDKYSIKPVKTIEEKTKIQPSLFTYGYVAKQQNRTTGTIKKPTKIYAPDTKNKPEVKAPEWTSLPMSAADYARNQYPMTPSDDPTIISQPLYRKFNADGLNDYCQILMETGYDKQQEVIIITEMIGYVDGWDTCATPLHIPLGVIHDVLDKLQHANHTRLRAFNKDNLSSHTFLWQSIIETGRTAFEFSIAHKEGPQGKE